MTAAALIALATAVHSPRARSCDQTTTIAMTTCADADYKAADAEMTVAWRATLAAMRRQDADPDAAVYRGKGDPTSAQALLDAQRAWLAFRDRQCRSEALAFLGGTMRPAVEASCLGEVTRGRTRQLRAMVQNR